MSRSSPIEEKEDVNVRSKQPITGSPEPLIEYARKGMTGPARVARPHGLNRGRKVREGWDFLRMEESEQKTKQPAITKI
jgi:hypothetical protein